MKIRIIGPGRAGRSFHAAFGAVGLESELLDRSAAVGAAGDGVDVVLIATPDRAIAEVAQAIEPTDAAVLHCSGATGIAVLAHHRRHGSVHPLMALPDAETGAARLADGGWFAVAGDPVAADLVAALGGRSFEVADNDRVLYHATAAISANHVVALLGQVERLAEQVGVPTEAFLAMTRDCLGDVEAKGAAAALTGPAARGDVTTLDAHRAALPPAELDLYNALVAAAERLATLRSQGP